MADFQVLYRDSKSWLLNCLGLMHRPYSTMRALSEKSTLGDVLLQWAWVIGVLGIVSLVRVHPNRVLPLTHQFSTLVLSVVVTHVCIVGLLLLLRHVVQSRVSTKGLISSWSYTLFPTSLWFFVSSLLYVAFPPPRSTHVLGVLLSIFYLVFSIVLLLWKTTLVYLVLRFSLRMGLFKIIFLACVMLPLITTYIFVMYRNSIFRVPFL